MARTKTTAARAPSGTNQIFINLWQQIRECPQENQLAIWSAIEEKMKGKIATLSGTPRAAPTTRPAKTKNAAPRRAAGARRKKRASTTMGAAAQQAAA